MEQYLINHCAPTLASLKTANLFNYSFASEYELEAQLLHLNTLLAVKGVSLTIIDLCLSQQEAGTRPCEQNSILHAQKTRLHRPFSGERDRTPRRTHQSHRRFPA